MYRSHIKSDICDITQNEKNINIYIRWIWLRELSVFDIDIIGKRYLFECDMGKYGTSAVFSHITRKMNNVCIFSHEKSHITYDIDFSSNYPLSVIWADTDIRLIVKITPQSVRS